MWVSALSAVRTRLAKLVAVAATTAVTATSKVRETMTTAAIEKRGDPERQFDFIQHAGRPTHTHTCPGDDTHGQHFWICDSPYCEIMQDNCPTHGGPPPVRIGREPWRGSR